MGLWQRLFGGHKASNERALNGNSDPSKGQAARNGENTQLATRLASVRKPAWIPKTAVGDSTPTASKFSGVAFIAKDEHWPACGSCAKPMQLFVQLAGKDLPEDAAMELGDDLLQLFYCTSAEPMCDVDTEAWLPFASNASLVRVVSEHGEPAIVATPVSNAFPCRSITGWQSATDYPHPDERAFAELNLSDNEADDACDTFAPTQGDKLAGWPAWVQGVEYPSCPTCNATMRVVMQLDSEDNLPHMFGDMGCGHITQCPTHLDVLAFGWACS